MSKSTANPPAFSSRKRTNRIDLGLAVSRLSLQPGQRRTLKEIAAYCECTKEGIRQIENNAILKLRARLQKLLGTDFQDHFKDFLKAFEE